MFNPSNVVDLSEIFELLSALGLIIILVCDVGAIKTPFPSISEYTA